MNCVYYNDLKPNGFEELFSFSRQAPYSLHIKKFTYEDIVPLHYAKTIEVLLCDDLRGEVRIDGTPYPLGGRQLFVIPPYILHSCHFQICSGTLYVLKISLPEIEHYFHIPHYLEACGCRLQDLIYACPEYEAASEVFSSLIRWDGNLALCLPQLLHLCRLFSGHTRIDQPGPQPASRPTLSELKELVQWTQENLSQKITLQEAAKKTGYSKNHFCNLFKELTGTTYFQYLNTARISHACFLLCQGLSVQEISSSCGFNNETYFIQVFKRVTHTTPKQYLARYR